jgi:dynamin 1-like protein
LILAVSSANTDLATSDGLALAREVDPKGVRTIGVLTKLDLAEETGGAVEALAGRVYPLQLGYIGIICRNEAASRKGVSFEDAIKSEEEFLSKSRIFRHLTHQCGVPHLAKRLHELLLRHIAEALPDLRTRISDLAEQFQEELNSYGNVEMEEKMGQSAFLLHLISSYARNFAQAIEGRLAYSLQEPLPDRLVYGARLNYIFHKIYSQTVMNFETFSGLPDLEIRAAMRNAAGPKPQLFVPEVAFESLVKRQIEKLEEPSLQCVHLVYEELKHIASQSEVGEMQRFPSLRDKILEVAHSSIRKCLPQTNQMVSYLVNIELAHINVDHPDFIGGLKAMSVVQGQFGMGEGGVQREPQQSLQQFLSDADQRSAPPPPASSRESSKAEKTSSGNSNRGSRGWWGGGGGGAQAQQPVDEQIRLPAVPTVVTPSGDMTEKERMDVELLKSLISSYFAIVKRKISDAVPKTVMNFMVNSVRDSLHHDCIAGLYQSDLINSLLKEGDDTKQRREQCKAKLTELRRSQDILAQVRNATLSI